MSGKKKSLAKVVDDCAVALQKLVRVKAAVAAKSEYVRCCCCGEYGHWLYEMDGGHFFSRKDQSVKIIEENIHPQLKGHNLQMGRGDQKRAEGYRRFMVETYGEDFIAELEKIAWKPVKHDRDEVLALTKQYRAQIKELEGEL